MLITLENMNIYFTSYYIISNYTFYTFYRFLTNYSGFLMSMLVFSPTHISCPLLNSSSLGYHDKNDKNTIIAIKNISLRIHLSTTS